MHIAKQKNIPKFRMALLEGTFMFLFMTGSMALLANEFPSVKMIAYNLLVWTLYGFLTTYIISPWAAKQFIKRTPGTTKPETQ